MGVFVFKIFLERENKLEQSSGMKFQRKGAATV